MNKINFGDAKKFSPSSFEERYNYYIKYTLTKAKIDGLWLEFGVATAQTTKKYVEFMPENNKPIYGFDSFLGLPENWAGHGKGAFSTKGQIPTVDGAKMIDGWFDNTLPKFMSENNKDISVLIVDCDVYSSTKTIFENCKNNIVEGTVIIFDEVHNYNDWENHEYKAFMEFLEDKKAEFEWIGYVDNGEQASCIITKIN